MIEWRAKRSEKTSEAMSEIQAVMFDKAYWDTKSAKLWLNKYKLKPIKRVHKTRNMLRYRLMDPKRFSHFIVKKVGKNIGLVIGFRK